MIVRQQVSLSEPAAAQPARKTPRLGLRSVILAGVAGILTGLFFGESAGVLEPVGQLYILLLEVAVYPYLICSLLHGLGSMQPGQALRLLRAGWPFYLGLWILTFSFLTLLSLAIPVSHALVWQPGTEGFSLDALLDALIPSDIVASISSNSIPAVILFGIFYGIALQHVPEKQSLLQTFDALAKASLKFWSAVVRMVPLAVFALFASAAGTQQPSDIEAIGYFLILFFAGALIMVVWLIPACIAALVPVRYHEVLVDLKNALLLGLVTTISVSALPYIVSATRRLADTCGIEDSECDDVIRTNISVAYPLGQLGNFFVYFFIVFCAFLMHEHIALLERILLPIVSLLSCFGSPTASVASTLFLGNWIGVGKGAQDLYVELMVLLRYPQVAVSIMGFAFLSFTVVMAYYGKLRVHWARLAAIVLVTFAVTAGGAYGARGLYEAATKDAPSPYLSFSVASKLTQAVDSRVLSADEARRIGDRSPGPVLPQIQRSGVLRVGFSPTVIPFCYYNDQDQLAGYDMEYAYQLAEDMNVRLEFVPFSWPTLKADLEAGRFDIAMSGIYVTKNRLEEFALSRPYYQSELAFFAPRANASMLEDRKTIEAEDNLRLGVFEDAVLYSWLARIVPKEQIVTVGDYDQLPDFSEIDGAFWTLLQSEALAAAYPEIVAVKPANLGSPVLFTYLMRKDALRLKSYVDYWLDLTRSSGFEHAQRRYWFERRPRDTGVPRWSILRNVLGIDL